MEEGDRVYVAEGPTDTAALVDIGLMAIGRPSCNDGVQPIRRWCQVTRQEAVIVMDSDGPGVAGAYSLADAILGHAPVTLIQPIGGWGDVRDWIQRGGVTRAAIEAMVDNVPPYQGRQA